MLSGGKPADFEKIEKEKRDKEETEKQE